LYEWDFDDSGKCDVFGFLCRPMIENLNKLWYSVDSEHGNHVRMFVYTGGNWINELS